MTGAELIAALAAEARRTGLDLLTTDVELDDGPEGPVIAVGTATRFDGHRRLLITSRDYATEVARSKAGTA